MELTIIIVNWNTRDLLASCLGSIYAYPPNCSFETWVVDNASSDGSLEMLNQNFPHVMVIENQVNDGFARANNQALRRVNGQFVLLLNSDTRVLENTLETIMDFIKAHPSVGALGVKLINEDGSFQASYAKFPTILSEFLLVSGLAKICVGPYAPSPPPRREEIARQVDWIAGAAMLVREQTIQQAGFLCERFFIYSEETDWCWKIWKSGWSIWYLPEVSVVHLHGGSSRQSSLTSYAQLYKSKIQFFELNYGKTRSKILKIMFRLIFSARCLAWKLLGILGLQNLFGSSIQQRLIQDQYLLNTLKI